MDEEELLVEEREFAFEVDSERMLRKIKKYLLSDPMDYVREFVQMSMLTGSESIHIKNSPFSFTIEDDGEGISQSDIESLLSRLFVGGDEGDAHDGFAMAVISAMEAGADKIVIESVKDGAPVRFTMDSDYNMQFFEAKRTAPGTKVVVKRHNLTNYFKHRRMSSKEVEKVKEYCKYMPIDFQLNGRPIRKNKGLEDVIVQVESHHEDSRVMLGLPKEEGMENHIVELLRGGIYYTDVSLETRNLRSVPLKARVDYDKFKLNLSRNEIALSTQDKKRIRLMLRRVVEDLTLKVCETYDKLRREDKERAKDYLIYQMGANRPALDKRQLTFELIFDNEVQEALANIPLFQTVARKKISLAEICEFADADGDITCITPEKMKQLRPYRFAANNKIENPRKLVVADEEEMYVLERIFNLNLVRYGQKEKEPPKPLHQITPRGPSKLDKLAQQFKEKKNDQRERFEERLRKAQSPYRRAYQSIADTWDRAWEPIIGSLEALVTRFDNGVSRRREAINRSIDQIITGINIKAGRATGSTIGTGLGYLGKTMLIAGRIAISPLVYLAKEWNSGTGHVNREWDDASLRRQEAQKERKLKREEKAHLRLKERERLQKLNEWERAKEEARRYALFNDKIKGLFRDYGGEELREMFNIGIKGIVKAAVGEPKWPEPSDIFIFLRAQSVYNLENKKKILVFNAGHPLTETLIEEMQEKNAEHVLMPAICHQLFRTDKRGRTYGPEKNPTELYTAVLTKIQERQIEKLLADSTLEFVRWYENDKTNAFKRHYDVLDEDVRRQVLAGVFSSDHLSAAIDEYLSRTDPDLVHEIGSKRVEQE